MNDRSPPAVVLAAGVGERLSPLTNTRPKPMLPLANRPLLEHVLEAIIAAGIDEVVFVVGYRQERIRNHFGDGGDWNVRIRYVEQEPQLGTGDAILQLDGLVDGDFLVLNGDQVVDAAAIEAVRDHEATPTMTVTGADFPSTFGVADVAGGELREIEEKPLDPSTSAQINAGVYRFDDAIFPAIREGPMIDGERPITAALNRLREDVDVLRYDGPWLDVTYVWDLLPVNAHRIPSGGIREDDAVGHDATVADDVAIGSGVQIGANATIGGSTAIGENVRIGANAVLENAVVFPDAEIGPGSVLKDAIVGANATLRANVTIAGGTATVPIDGTLHEDVTLGAVIGDNADVGGGTVLSPGTLIGDGADVESGARADGVVPSDATLRRG